MTRPWYPVSREFWQHPDWCKRSAHERLAWLYLLSVTRWRDGDGIKRGQARTSAADIGREVDKPRARAHDWLKRWASIGAISYEVEVDEAKRPTGVLVTVLGYERWVAYARPDAADTDGSGVSDERPDAKAYANRKAYAKAYAAADARPDAKAYAGNTDDSGVSDEVAYARPDAAAYAGPDARPDASYIGHDLGHEKEGDTRALTREATPSLPGLDSPEGDTGTRRPSPTSSAPVPAPPVPGGAVAGTGSAAVERRQRATPLGVRVRQTWMAVHRERVKLEMPRPDATRSYRPSDIDEVTRTVAQLAEDVGEDAAIETWRRIVERYHADEGRNGWLRDKGWPLGALLKSWDQYAREATPRQADPADPADPHGWANFVPDEFDAEQDRIFEEMMREQGVWNGK